MNFAYAPSTLFNTEIINVSIASGLDYHFAHHSEVFLSSTDSARHQAQQSSSHRKHCHWERGCLLPDSRVLIQSCDGIVIHTLIPAQFNRLKTDDLNDQEIGCCCNSDRRWIKKSGVAATGGSSDVTVMPFDTSRHCEPRT